MTPRIEFRCVDPKMRQRLQGIKVDLRGSSLGRRLPHPTKARALRFNGCAQRRDMVTRDARAEGEPEQRFIHARRHPDLYLETPERRLSHGAQALSRRCVRAVNRGSRRIIKLNGGFPGTAAGSDGIYCSA